MSIYELKRLAKKYLNDTASTEEKNRLNVWYNTVLEDEGVEVVTKETRTETEIKQYIFKNIQKRKQAFNSSVIHSSVLQQNHKRSVKKLWLGIVSTAAVLALVYFGISSKDTKNTASPYSFHVASASKNKISKLTMPDGSKIWLNVGAVLKYPKKFTGKTRTVELLKGHAFFDIKHQNEHPFVVKAKGMNVVVLGTSFDVNGDEKTNLTSVSVVTGKVGITMTNPKNKQPAVILWPRQQAVLSNITNSIQTKPVEDDDISDWRNNNFVFEQEKMSDVFNTLSKEYGIKIKVENKKLLEESISITISNQHIDTIMKVLSFSKHFKYKYHTANDSTIIIK